MSLKCATPLLFFMAAALCLLIDNAPAAEIHFFRTPAPSPDGTKIAFGYQGDIWLVDARGGRAVRLTAHEAYEHHPVWSPDGREIAFASDRNGNDDVFVMPASGGQPEQLTYFTGNDVPTGWTADGKNILFYSLRDLDYHRLPATYSVPRAGGQPFEYFLEYSLESTVSPDGKAVAYSSGDYRTWRKGYRGSADLDVYHYQIQDRQFRRLTDFDGHDFNPLWRPDGQAIYYISEADGTYNLWRLQLDTGAKTQLTSFHGDGLRSAGIARSAGVIVFEQGTELWRFDPQTGQVSPIEIEATSDLSSESLDWKEFSKDAQELAVSPAEDELAFVVRGEVFVQHAELDHAMNVSNSPYRDQDISWSRDGKTLIFSSDRSGAGDIYAVTSADTGQAKLSLTLRTTMTQLTHSPLPEFSPKFSPDGKKIALVRDKGELIVMDADGKNQKVLLSHWSTPDFNWSPDSRWIAYEIPDAEFNNEIWIVPADGAAPAVNITQHPDNDGSPVWSSDGSKLGFISRRRENNLDVWFVFLRKADDEKSKDDFKIEAALQGKKGNKEKTEEPPPTVQIDFAGIHKRLRRLTQLPGDEGRVAISPDGALFAFTANTEGKTDLWTVKWDGTELKQITTGGQNPAAVQFSKDGKKLTYLRGGGTIMEVGVDGKNSKGIKFSAKMNIDHREERKQVFAEAWRTLDRNFYDPKFHGADWKAMRAKYAPMAETAYNRRDFQDVVNLMLGELNASHLGFTAAGGDGPENNSGMLGLRFDPADNGDGLLVAAVTPNGPTDKANARVVPGDRLMAVRGTSVNRRANINRLLLNTVDEKVIVSIRRRSGAVEDIVVTPINFGAWRQLEYERWRLAKARKVHELSNNRIGYIHIQAMGAPSLEQFEEELYSEAHDKDGLIIDVRRNGGGWTTDMILAIIEVQPHAVTIPRDGSVGYPQDRRPLYAWSKPVTVLCDEFSISNAEIFSHAIKTLKRGKLVGVPTYGGVISTGGRRLLDGSFVRMPFRGWYVAGSNVNMENHGAVPDVIVHNLPGEFAQGIDRQLEKAVEISLQEAQR